MNNITRLLFIGGLVINWSALGQRQARSLPSLRADVTDTFTRQLVDGNTVVSTTVGTFYRDQEGRTRTERGNLIVIQDPTIRVTIVLDTKAKTARQFAVGQGARASAPIPSSSSNSTSASSGEQPSIPALPPPLPAVDLGTKTVAGIKVTGKQVSAVVPKGAVGNIRPIKQVTEIWRSEDLEIPIMIKASDAMNGDHVQLYSNIVSGVKNDPALFVVPSEFQSVPLRPPLPQSGTATFGVENQPPPTAK